MPEQEFDSLFEAVFGQAVIDNHRRELKEIPSGEELTKIHTFSQTHEARMKKLFAEDRRKGAFGQVSKWMKRTAAAIAVIALLLSGIVLSSQHGREAVRKTFIELHEKLTKQPR